MSKTVKVSTKKSTTTQDTAEYLSLKRASAPKLGTRASGQVHYELLADPERTQLFVRITGNDGGGYFSQEAVPIAKIEETIAYLDAGAAFPSRTFRCAFIGKSVNNAGFLACALRAEGLLG